MLAAKKCKPRSHSRFQVLCDFFAEDAQEAVQLNAEKQTLSSQHKTCRDVEAEKRRGKRECEMEVHRKYTTRAAEEEELRLAPTP